MSIQSLLKFRYALGQGTASFAVDIEEAVHDGVSEGIATAVRLSQHQIQRRNEKSFLKEESTVGTGWYWLIWEKDVEH
ncbi:hypothetical protein RGQ29_018329 [Quercus rubra]|uniref:Uncharacterized protein n=1 Tax=Quercus rubra TaxID=3512 RepID=A0AAN7FJ02_QUERU|nr:hypothetical protein RGQ29_018329 [Quercus rubra]